jgi:hypothetical protein
MHKGNFVCTWLYADRPGESSTYYQVYGNSAEFKVQKIYWKAVCVYFASSKRTNPEAQHILFTNCEELPFVDGCSVSDFLQKLKVEVVRLDLTYQTPKGFYGAWRNQFYIFDIIKYLSTNTDDSSKFIVLDSDCIYHQSSSPIFNALDKFGTLSYDINYPEDHTVNGLTRKDMKKVFEEVSGHKLDQTPHYFGGEFFASTGKEIKRMNVLAEKVWNENLSRYKEGKKKFNEEAHMLSYLYFILGYQGGTADSFIRRIWTYPFMDNTKPEDFNLIAWHLPYEKNWGIKTLFPKVINPNSKFWAKPIGKDFSKYVAEKVGIKKNVYRNKVMDLVNWSIRKSSIELEKIKKRVTQ